MSEKTLASAIDRLAQRRANNIIEQLENTLATSLRPYFRHKDANDAFIGEDIKNVLLYYVKTIGAGSVPVTSPRPSENLVSACRAAILNDLLNGLPKIKELIELQEQQ